MKKIIISTFIVLFSFVLTSPTLASEKDYELEDLVERGVIIYQDDEITVRDLGNDPVISDLITNDKNSVVEEVGIEPLTVGPGGKATLTAAENGRTIFWNIKPNSLWPYVFKGNINLSYHSGFERDASIDGAGALGEGINGSVTMNKNNGGYATMTGSAYSLDFTKRDVLPGVGVSF